MCLVCLSDFRAQGIVYSQCLCYPFFVVSCSSLDSGQAEVVKGRSLWGAKRG